MQSLEDYGLRGLLQRRQVDAGPSPAVEARRLLEKCRAERVGRVEARVAHGLVDVGDLDELNRVAQALRAREQAAGSLSPLDQATAARALVAVAKIEGRRARVAAVRRPRVPRIDAGRAPMEYRC